MIFDFDAEKDAINRAKHGVSLALAGELFAGLLTVKPDGRKDYGELRNVAHGFINGRLFVCVFTDRGEIRRIILLRKANKREHDAYYQSNASKS